MKSKQASVPFPIAVNKLNHYKLPLLGRKKKAIHTKNPFKAKIYLIPDDSAMSIKTLDGFLLLKQTKSDVPHEIIKADLSRKRIQGCRPEDFHYFLYLQELDISENQIKLEDIMNFPALKTLKISANNMRDIAIDENHMFMKLQELDLSFNYLTVEAINSLAYLPELTKLHLVNNELQELPPDMSQFKKLANLDVSDNNFSSKHKPQDFWYTLGVVPMLSQLNVSRNFLRGIHVERLRLGCFAQLEVLDFSYNMAENQHNLICARNFMNLQTIIVTGNPFAVMREHQGLEMEVHARTGAVLINDDIEKPYLKKKKPPKAPVRYEQLKRVADDIFRLPLIEPSQADEEEQEIIEDNADALFVTENQNNRQPQQQQQQAQSQQYHTSPQKPQNYDDFKVMAQEVLGDSKEYDIQQNKQMHDLTAAYQKLKSVMSKPDAFDYEDFNEPNYMRPTASIPRYKYAPNDEPDEPSTIQRHKKQTDNVLASEENEDVLGLDI